MTVRIGRQRLVLVAAVALASLGLYRHFIGRVTRPPAASSITALTAYTADTSFVTMPDGAWKETKLLAGIAGYSASLSLSLHPALSSPPSSPMELPQLVHLRHV
jgi:hypothetical protein